MFAQRHHQAREQLRAGQRPVAQRLACDAHTVPGKDALLAIQRNMIGILRHQYLREQTRTCVGLRQWRGVGCSSTDRGRPRSVLAAVLAACMLDHRQARRGVLEGLADLFADARYAGELRALGFIQFVLDARARQILG